MNKKELYESIMKEVSRQVKKALNENAPFYEKGTDGVNRLKYVCTEAESKEINDVIDEYVAANMDISDAENGCIEMEIDIDHDMMINGEYNNVYGTVLYDIALDDEDSVNYEHIDKYELSFIDDDGKEYEIYLNKRELSQVKNDYTTPVKTAYEQQQSYKWRMEQREQTMKEQEEERQYIRDCKNNPKKYIEVALQYENKYRKYKFNYLYQAEKIYKILGMDSDAERIREFYDHEFMDYDYRRSKWD